MGWTVDNPCKRRVREGCVGSGNERVRRDCRERTEVKTSPDSELETDRIVPDGAEVSTGERGR